MLGGYKLDELIIILFFVFYTDLISYWTINCRYMYNIGITSGIGLILTAGYFSENKLGSPREKNTILSIFRCFWTSCSSAMIVCGMSF